MSLLDPAPSGPEGSSRDAGDDAEPTPDGLAGCCWRAGRSAKAPKLAGEARVSLGGLGGEVCSAPCRPSGATHRPPTGAGGPSRRASGAGPGNSLNKGGRPGSPPNRLTPPRAPSWPSTCVKPRPGSGERCAGLGRVVEGFPWVGNPHGLDRYPVTRQSTMLDREEEAATMDIGRSASLGRGWKRRLRGPG